MRWSQTRRSEVVDTSTAEAIGRIDAMVIDAKRSSISALVVGDKVVPWSDAGGVGTDALTISSGDLLRSPETDAEVAATQGATEALSKPVITEDGFSLGALEDLEFDPGSGSIERLILAGDDIAGSRLIGVGSFAVIVGSAESSNGGDDDLDELTKDELYEKAKDRDIDGRSSMTKDELVAALREQ